MGGRLDVDDALDSITPEMMDEWVSFRNVEADPLRRIAEILVKGFASLIVAQSVTEEPQELVAKLEKYLDPEARMESDYAGNVTPDQAVRVLSSMVGKSRGHSNR